METLRFGKSASHASLILWKSLLSVGTTIETVMSTAPQIWVLVYIAPDGTEFIKIKNVYSLGEHSSIDYSHDYDVNRLFYFIY